MRGVWVYGLRWRLLKVLSECLRLCVNVRLLLMVYVCNRVGSPGANGINLWFMGPLCVYMRNWGGLMMSGLFYIRNRVVLIISRRWDMVGHLCLVMVRRILVRGCRLWINIWLMLIRVSLLFIMCKDSVWIGSRMVIRGICGWCHPLRVEWRLVRLG